MPIDYEVEYDNRARVHEHPEIFARWQREAAAYRAAAHNAKLGITYGPSLRRTIDMFPAKDDDKAPLAMFIHGGWWRSLEPAMFSQMAAGPNGRGITVAVAGYDLCPNCSIADIIEQMRAACLSLWRKRRQRIFIYGHSAGGHLAACMVAQDWKTLASDAPADLVPAAYAISGVFDLLPLVHVSQNQDLRLDEAEARRVSPLYWRVPAGRSLDAVVGALESSEFLRQSRTVVESWRQGMALTRYEEIAGANHFTVIDPLNDPNSAMTARVAALANSVNSAAL
ncbi:MAG TPA: alpha/beta hydrolase [Pseudolabrys sp.]|jgi:arylformamidase|nr:alpha/beta hydrolase [Pseudolabrys sp.]